VFHIRFAKLQNHENFHSTLYNNGENILYLALPYNLTFEELDPYSVHNYYDHIWANSTFVKNSLESIGVNRDIIDVVPHGINPDVFNPLVQPINFNTKKNFKFLNVSIPYLLTKGLDVLIDAYFEEFSENDDVCLVLKSRYLPNQNIKILEYIDRTKKRTKQNPEILFLDTYSPPTTMAQIYNACNCYIQTSRVEAFGLPVLEAMASGLPVIVTGHGGMMDFTNKDFALYIEYKMVQYPQKCNELSMCRIEYWAEPNKNDLRRKMRYLYSNPKVANDMGRLANQHAVKYYSWDEIAKKVLQILIRGV
jgi:glycosyltransferase involved in cell wall biosynthesis